MFYFRKLPVTSSVCTIIEFNVSYPKMSYKEPVINIDMTYPAINIQKQCSYRRYGQFYNKNLHEHLSVGQHETAKCESSGVDIMSCRGRVNVQDYIPRNFSQTFGFHCDWPRINSLQGLRYKVSVTKQSNETNSCMNYFHPKKTTITPLFLILLEVDIWLKFKNFFERMNSLLLWVEDVINIWWKYYVMYSYQNVTLFQQVIHPCREMCWDNKDVCLQKWSFMATKLVPKYGKDRVEDF